MCFCNPITNRAGDGLDETSRQGVKRHVILIVVALGIILAIGGMFLSLAVHQILPRYSNIISNLGMKGVVLGYCLIGAGVVVMVASFLYSKCSRKMPLQEISPEHHSKIEKWTELLESTNERLYAEKCIQKLVDTDVPIDGYERLVIWWPSRYCPSIICSDGVASDLNFEKFSQRSILLIVVVATDPTNSSSKNPKLIKARALEIIKEELSTQAGDLLPQIVLQFADVQRGGLFSEPRMILSDEQCAQIGRHEGETI